MPNQMRTMDAIRSVTARDAIFIGDANVATHRGAAFCLPVYEPRTYMTPQVGRSRVRLPLRCGR